MAAFCCITCIAQEKEALETDVVLNLVSARKVLQGRDLFLTLALLNMLLLVRMRLEGVLVAMFPATVSPLLGKH